MDEKVAILSGLPYWIWVMLVPVGMLVLLLGWLTNVLGRQNLTRFRVRGLGLSVRITATPRTAKKEV